MESPKICKKMGNETFQIKRGGLPEKMDSNSLAKKIPYKKTKISKLSVPTIFDKFTLVRVEEEWG